LTRRVRRGPWIAVGRIELTVTPRPPTSIARTGRIRSLFSGTRQHAPLMLAWPLENCGERSAARALARSPERGRLSPHELRPRACFVCRSAEQRSQPRSRLLIQEQQARPYCSASASHVERCSCLVCTLAGTADRAIRTSPNLGNVDCFRMHRHGDTYGSRLTAYEQQVGPQHVLGSGFRARMNALATLPSTCGAI
jgi:hypothetical protein